MNKNIFRIVLPAASVLLIIVLGLYFVQSGYTETAGKETDNLLSSAGFQLPTRSTAAPDFSLNDLSGKKTSLSSYKGKIVLLNFWATWCPPCRAEMPSMEKMYGMFDREEFELLAVDVQENEKTVSKFITENGYTFPILLDTTGRIGSTYGVRGIPTSYLIDRDGTLLGMLVGSREWDTPSSLELLKHLIEK